MRYGLKLTKKNKNWIEDQEEEQEEDSETAEATEMKDVFKDEK